MPYVSTEALVGAALVVLLAFGYQYSSTSTSQGASSSSAKKNKKKSKRKGGKAGIALEAQSSVTASEVDSDAPASSLSKPPASKSKKTPTSNVSKPATTLPVAHDIPAKSEPTSFADAAGGSSQPAKPKTLAEKLVPKPRKTKVDDMLAPEDRAPHLARVMKITPDRPPAAPSHSSEDQYEVDYSDSGASTPARQDDEWNVVAAKKKPVSLSIGSSGGAIASNPHSKDGLTKIQRKNAKKAEVKKAQREAEEADRLRRLASHKRDLERNKINEIYSKQQKVVRQAGKVVSAGQAATMNDKGQLVWD